MWTDYVPQELPLTLGHENAGTVIETGPERRQELYGTGYGHTRFDDSEGFPALFPDAIDWLRTAGTEEPVFMYIHGKTLHDPYGAGAPEDITQRIVDPYNGTLAPFRYLAHGSGGFGHDVLGRIRKNGSGYFLVERYNGQLLRRSTVPELFDDPDQPVIQERLRTVNETHLRVTGRGRTLWLDQEDIQHVRQQYWSGVRHFDRLFGLFLSVTPPVLATPCTAAHLGPAGPRVGSLPEGRRVVGPPSRHQ